VLVLLVAYPLFKGMFRKIVPDMLGWLVRPADALVSLVSYVLLLLDHAQGTALTKLKREPLYWFGQVVSDGAACRSQGGQLAAAQPGQGRQGVPAPAGDRHARHLPGLLGPRQLLRLRAHLHPSGRTLGQPGHGQTRETVRWQGAVRHTSATAR